MDPILRISVCVVLLCAVYLDVREHRLPNRLTYLAAVVGVGLNIFLMGLDGLIFAAEGWLAGLLTLLPLYLFGRMGGGDVKLMAGLGAFLGPKAVLIAVIFTVLAGGVIGIALLLWHRGGGALVKRYWMMLQSLCLGQMSYIPPAPGEPAGRTFPYALAIATGTLLVIFGLGAHLSHL